MQREWRTGARLTSGAVVFDWQRPFTLWGYTGSHSVVLFRSVKALPGEDGPATRIDLVFKPVDVLNIRTAYRTLTVRMASQERTDQILGPPKSAYREDCVLELLGPDGGGDHIVCLAVGCHEDTGEYWEPSPFAADPSDGRTPPWRTRVLGGGPDGELTAHLATRDEVTEAIRPRGRFLFLVMSRMTGTGSRASSLSAFLTRDEAEQFIETEAARDGIRSEYWIDVVPLDL